MLNNNSEISRFEDLMCWQEARKYKIEILNLANSLPSHEIFGLTSQLRRSGSSITANIAEGVGRSLPKAIIQYLRQARGSLYETLDHSYTALDMNYINQSQFDKIQQMHLSVSKILNGYIRYQKTRIEK